MRYPEIDIIKGFAVVLMVIFHFYYLAHFMNIKKYQINNGVLRCFAVVAHTIFIVMVGINLALGYQRSKENNKDNNAFFGKNVKRSLFLYFAGTLVSIFSYVAFDNLFVKFGIFHFIATAILLAQPIVHSKLLALMLTIIIILVFILKFSFDSILYDKSNNIPLICFITGLYNVKYSSLDHFPLIPYLSYIFLGIFLGHILYKKAKRNFNGSLIDKVNENPIVKSIGSLGKKSLLIYFIHFPIFYFILYFFKNLNKSKDIIQV